MGFEVENLDGLYKRFDELVDRDNIKEAMQDACLVVETSAKQKAPKGTGALRRSIQSKVVSMPTEVTGIVFTPLFYSAFVEMGTGLFAEKEGRKDVPWRYQDDNGKWHTTSGMKPQPYLRPALYENRSEIKRILGEGILDD